MNLQLGKNMSVWKPGRQTTIAISKMPRRLIPSDEQWEAHKEHIIQLYIDDNMSLNRVMQTMQDWYQFKASYKMYKRRIRQWNLRKYFTAKDIPDLERQREAGSDTGHLVLGVCEVDSRRYDSFLKRRAPPSQRRASPAQRQASRTPADTRLSLSPLPTSSPPEILFSSIRSYLNIASPGFIWYKDTQDRLCISRAGGINGRFRLSRFHDRLLVAVNSFTYDSSLAELKRSREVMGECMDEMKIILSEQDPFLLANVFHILLQIKNRQPPQTSPEFPSSVDNHNQRLELDQVVVDYGRNLSTIALGESHPLTVVWTVLGKALKMSSDRQMVFSALELVLDEFEAQLGTDHAGSLIMRLHLYSSRGDARWKQVVIKFLTILEEGHGSSGPGGWGRVKFSRLKQALETNELSQQHVTRVTKFICRILRSRLRNTEEDIGGHGGNRFLLLEDTAPADPEAELVQCLSSPLSVIDADYLP